MNEISFKQLLDLLEKLDSCPSEKRVKLLSDIGLASIQYNKLAEKIKHLERQVYVYWLLKNPTP